MFIEPDFPDVLPQVPGGTVEPGEATVDAAKREFVEETGLKSDETPVFLTTLDYHAQRDGGAIHHRRHFFHIPLRDTPPDTWHHYELHPSGRDTPVLLQFFWLDISQATELLGYEMERAVGLLPT